MDSNLFGVLIGVVSFFVTIGIFIYQQNREKIKKSKEVELLTEDIISQVVRNSTQNNIKFVEINIEYLIDGFALLRNVDLNCTLVDLLKMIYMKIYENDYVVKSDKVSILNEIEHLIKDYKTRSWLKTSDEAQSGTKLGVLFSLIVTLLVYILGGLFLSSYYGVGEFNLLTFIQDPIWITMVISLFILIGVTYIYKKIRVQLAREEKLKSYEKTFSFNLDEFIKVEENDSDVSLKSTNENSSVPHSNNDDLNSEVTIKNAFSNVTDNQKKLNLGEMVYIRQNIERELNLLYYKFFNEDRWVNPTYALRKLAALIQNSDLSEELQNDGHNSYNLLRRIISDLNMAIHEYPWKIEIEPNIIVEMKKDSKECIEKLKNVLSRC